MSDNSLIRTAGSAASSFLAVKLAVPAAVIFLAVLMIAGVLADPGRALAAQPCGDRGQPEVEVEQPEGPRSKQQVDNASIIDSVASSEGLPGRATLIALMTALQESTLLNIDYGDRDSVGLFQQRPSQGWGTVKEIMDPAYSSRMFFLGGDGGDPPGLTDIKGWRTMPLGEAAQEVQRSAYPSLYTGHQSRARAIAAEANIDLDRPTAPNSTGPDDEEDKLTPEELKEVEEECYPEQPDAGTAEGDFGDGEGRWPSQVSNPRSTAAAIRWARAEASGGQDWFRLCLAFVARAYGWNYSGVIYAIDHYRQMPQNMRHDKDRTPPPGALMYWDTGQRAGHVAIYLGGGKIASNDITRPGYIDVVEAEDIEKKWAATYLGWAPPHFPQGG